MTGLDGDTTALPTRRNVSRRTVRTRIAGIRRRRVSRPCAHYHAALGYHALVSNVSCPPLRFRSFLFAVRRGSDGLHHVSHGPLSRK